MARDIPSAPKVYTTTYDNFKGVDFTNDSTNVWRRRSPTGVNMLPDASGRPFKRHGWDILLSQTALRTALGVDSCTIYKLAYFELAGVDHIVIFTDGGVVFYNGDESADSYGVEGITYVETDNFCKLCYDRCFFFEGDGTSAFYIYGNYRMWRYDTDFVLKDITDELYVPRVIISASADCVGTTYEDFNLLYNMAKVEYNDYDLFTFWGSDGLDFTVDDVAFKSTYTEGAFTYRWQYDGNDWVWNSSEHFSPQDPEFDGTIIDVNNPTEDAEIVVLYGHGLMLPNNVDIGEQGESVKVDASFGYQFSTPVEVVTDKNDFISGTCLLVADDTNKRTNRQAHIEFYPTDVYKTGVEQNGDFEGMDTFRVKFPSTQVDVTEYSDTKGTELHDTGTATLVGGGN